MSILEYLEKHKLLQKIKDLVNRRLSGPKVRILFVFIVWQILDSRGKPIVEVDLYTGKGMFRVAVPSGASTKCLFVLAWDTIEDVCMQCLQNQALQELQVYVYTGQDLYGLASAIKWAVLQGSLGENAILAVSMANCKARTNEERWIQLKKLESEKCIFIRFVVGRSANKGDSSDRSIDSESIETEDLLILEFVWEACQDETQVLNQLMRI